MGDEVLAEIRQYSDLHIALRARAEVLNISRESIDGAANLAKGHASKILAPYPMRALGRTTLGPVLYALGVKLLLVPDEEAMNDPRLVDERAPRDKAKARIPKPVQYELANQPEARTLQRKLMASLMKRLGRKGGKASGPARMKKMSASARRRVARHAIKVRWKRERAKPTPEHFSDLPLSKPKAPK